MQKCYLEMQKEIVYQKDYLAEFMSPNDVSQIEIFSTLYSKGCLQGILLDSKSGKVCSSVT